MGLSEFLPDLFLEHTKRTQPIAIRQKPAIRSAKEASAYPQTQIPSDRVQQTNSPTDHGGSTEHFRCIPGCNGTAEDALYNKVASIPNGIQYVGIQYQLADIS